MYSCVWRTHSCVQRSHSCERRFEGVEMSLDTARKGACATIAFLLGLSALLSGAVILDRIAVIAGTHVIKASDIDRDTRLTDFLNRAPLDFSADAKREAAERLITQQIIRDE